MRIGETHKREGSIPSVASFSCTSSSTFTFISWQVTNYNSINYEVVFKAPRQLSEQWPLWWYNKLERKLSSIKFKTYINISVRHQLLLYLLYITIFTLCYLITSTPILYHVKSFNIFIGANFVECQFLKCSLGCNFMD